MSYPHCLLFSMLFCLWQFLEALCRLSQLKALPTDDEINAALVSEGWLSEDSADAGTYMLTLSGINPARYKQLMTTRCPPWGVGHESQPVWRAVDHLIHMLIVKCQGGLSRKVENGYKLTPAQAEWLFSGAGKSKTKEEKEEDKKG